MTEEQLLRLLSATRRMDAPAATSQGSFARCTARYDGTCCRQRLEEFVATAPIFRDIENITDGNAVKGLPLLLEGEAAIWWQGVKRNHTTWRQAMDALQQQHAPRRSAPTIYAELFVTKQDGRISTDAFLAGKRALLAELPHHHEEGIQLDMVYALLKLSLRDKIPRSSVATFDDLTQRARDIEALEQERESSQQTAKREPPPTRNRVRCTYCRKDGHSAEECRRKRREQTTTPRRNRHSQHQPPFGVMAAGNRAIYEAVAPPVDKPNYPASNQPNFAHCPPHSNARDHQPRYVYMVTQGTPSSTQGQKPALRAKGYIRCLRTAEYASNKAR
ncbi:activity-regulated cytoskeleton associated protein 1 [Colletes latitarsis]|uniref:activity-regulated cytoskeleton associated protein 1 n=1 Tax=Colletes latitarsis TaxID=2605962 RepID=UPI004036E191